MQARRKTQGGDIDDEEASPQLPRRPNRLPYDGHPFHPREESPPHQRQGAGVGETAGGEGARRPKSVMAIGGLDADRINGLSRMIRGVRRNLGFSGR